ncbi:MAG: hypothetical protein IKT34_02135 [Clostridia bacterium]|nr:hypothetical protein [Clostridia bacterium]
MKKLLSILLAIFCLTMPICALAEGESSLDEAETNDIYVVAEKLVFQHADTTLPYRLLLPKEYDESKSYPILFFFHGAGERGNNNEAQLFHCVQYIYDNLPEPAFIVAPQCPAEPQQWVDTPWIQGAYSVENVPESNELKAVVELLGELSGKYSLDANRVYCAGLSMGGFATWDLIMRHNDIFAAAMPICGGGDPNMGEVLKDTPIFTFHAKDDTAVPVSGTQVTVNAIKEAGGTKIEYVEYPSGGHGIWNKAVQTEGILDKLFACELYDRYPEKRPVEPTPEVNSDTNEDDEKSFFNATTITLIVSVVIAAIITAIFTVLKKKKKA